MWLFRRQRLFLAVADKVTNAPIDESTHVFVDH